MSVPSSRSIILSVLSLAVAFMVTVSSFSPAPPAPTEKERASAKRQAAKDRGWKRPAAHHEEPQEWHTLNASYYDTRDRWSSKLTLNNKGRDAAQPVVTLFNPHGRPYVVPNVVVPGTGFLEIELGRAARRAGGTFAAGSVSVKYYGKKLQMGAQVLVQDLERGLQLDEQLTYAGYSYVNRLEGLWWRPNERARMSIVMTNLSEERIEVRGRVKGPERGGRPEGGLSRFHLDPHEQRIVPFDGDGGGRLRGGDTAGGVSLEFDGPHGALLARLLVDDPRSGYSASLALNPATGAKTSTYHGGGLRRSSGDARLLPVLLARNLSDDSSILTGRLVFNRPDGTVDRIALPQTTLEAGETALIDARNAWGIVQDQAGDEGIGVEFEYTSAPGSVLMSAGLVSGDRNLVLRVPLIDPETPKSSTGGYPWFADDERTTTVFLKNTTTTKVIYHLQISHEGGTYAPGIKEIEPGQTLAIDVRRLRDEQVPDAFGNTIPSNARSGQVRWTIKSTTQYAMIGRAEHTDHEHGVSASYACLSCCPETTYAVWIADDPTAVGVGGTVELYVMMQDEDCYHNLSAEYSMPFPYLNDWYLGDTGIATSYSDSTVYGVSDGQTTFYADAPGVAYHVEGYEGGWYCALDQFSAPAQAPVQTVPSISGPNNVWHFGGQSPSGYDLSITLTSSAGGSTTWALVAGSDKVNLSSTSGQSIQVTSNGSTFSSAVGDIKVTATANSQTSPQFAITSRKPFRLAVTSSDTVTCPDSTWGWETRIHYAVQDQLLSNLPSGVPLNEKWSTGLINDWSGTNWRRGAEGSITSVTFDDLIQGEHVNLPPNPTTACSNNSAVQHWGQEWWIGSLTPGSGVKVQDKTLQKRRGFAQIQ